MTVRDAQRGTASVERVRDGIEGPGSAGAVLLDLADLTLVRASEAGIRERTEDRIDVLVNNAAVSLGPHGRTRDEFELQIGTNHLGPAALTWLLMPALRAAGNRERPSRVVTTSSLGHRTGGLDPTDPHWESRRYSPTRAYGASKLTNLLFASELDRRLRRAGDPVLSVAAHPGLTASNCSATPSPAEARGGPPPAHAAGPVPFPAGLHRDRTSVPRSHRSGLRRSRVSGPNLIRRPLGARKCGHKCSGVP